MGMTTTAKPSLTVKPHFREAVEKKIAQMNRRAAKLGLAPITAEFVERIEYFKDHGVVRSYMVLDLFLTGNAPKLNGWTLLCRVEHTKEGNLLSAPTGSKEDLSPWFTAEPTCEHCNASRGRRDTFVLRNESGEVVRVGRNCLADFVRSENAVKVAMAAMWGDFFSCDEEDSGCGWGHSQYEVLTIVSHAVAAIRVCGAYVPASCESGTTRGTVSFALSCPRNEWTEQMKAEWRSLQATESDKERAKLVIEWAKVQAGSNYAHNLSVACSMLAETDRTRGILVSAPAAYSKAIGEEATRAKLAALPKVEPKAGRYEVSGVVKTLKLQENDFGSTLKMLVVVETDNGVWNGWGTVPSGLDLSEGDSVTVKATVQPKEAGFAILSRPTVVKVAA